MLVETYSFVNPFLSHLSYFLQTLHLKKLFAFCIFYLRIYHIAEYIPSIIYKNFNQMRFYKNIQPGLSGNFRCPADCMIMFGILKICHFFIPDHRNHLLLPVPIFKGFPVLRVHQCLAGLHMAVFRHMNVFRIWFQAAHGGIIQIQVSRCFYVQNILSF